jgi:hypothetical protein
MKKLYIYLAFIFVNCLSGTYAQVQSVHDPNLSASITNEQVLSWAKAFTQIEPGITLLNFEGLGNLEAIGQFYSGSPAKSSITGPNYGISFSGNAKAIINSGNGGTGNFTRDILPNTVLFTLAGSELKLNVPAGFNEELSLDYSSSAAGVITIYDGPEGTGAVLASKDILPLSLGLKGVNGAYYDNWKRAKVKFPGTARSVVFTFAANQCAFDDILLGSETSGHSKGIDVISTSSSKRSFASILTTPGSQTEKGKLFLDGSSSLQMNIGSSKSKTDGEVEEGSGYNYFDFNFLPKAGYFFIPNMVGGLFMDIEFYSNKSKNESSYQSKGTTFIIGPFARYYVPLTDQFMPFVEVQIGGGIDNSKYNFPPSDDWSKSKETVFSYRLGGGGTYFFNEIVGCDLFLGYQHDSYKYKDNGDNGESSDSKSIYNQFTVQLGIIVVLDL